MKICMLTWEYPPRIVGGIARHCFALSRFLTKLGHDVRVITLRTPDAPAYELVGGVSIYRVDVNVAAPNFESWIFLLNHFLEKKAADIHTSSPFDLIHAHDWLTAIAGVNTKHFTRKPLTLTLHSTEIGRSLGVTSLWSRMVDAIERLAVREASQIIVTSQSMKDEVSNHFKVHGDKMNVIPNGIDPTRFHSSFNRRTEKWKYGVTLQENLVLFIGRLLPPKGCEYLIRAVPAILKRHPNTKLVVVGDGLQRWELEGMARSIANSDRIRFTGFIPDEDLTKLLLCADVLVVPSVYEPHGIIALEGMTADTPVVVSDVGGLAEIVQHESTGLYVHPGNPDSIAWGVNRILSDPSYAMRLARNAKKIVRSRYAWVSVAKHTLEVYSKAKTLS